MCSGRRGADESMAAWASAGETVSCGVTVVVGAGAAAGAHAASVSS